MLKHMLTASTVILTITACSTFNSSEKFQKPENLLFINKELNTFPLHVQRNEKLCKDEQNCPIKLYINDFKAGDFYINNTTTYYLKPNEYLLTVKNCKEKCDTFNIKININKDLPIQKLTLSLDQEGKPFIINNK